MTPIPEATVEAAARALHRREMERATNVSAVLSKAAGKPVTDAVEPFEEHVDTWMGDARAALEAAREHGGGIARAEREACADIIIDLAEKLSDCSVEHAAQRMLDAINERTNREYAASLPPAPQDGNGT